MENEQIVLTSIRASVQISWAKPRGGKRSRQSEGHRILNLLRRVRQLDLDKSIQIGNITYHIRPVEGSRRSNAFRVADQPKGGWATKIVLDRVEGDDRVILDVNLTKDFDGLAGKLSIAWDPAAALVGPDLCPTLADPEFGQVAVLSIILQVGKSSDVLAGL